MVSALLRAAQRLRLGSLPCRLMPSSSISMLASSTRCNVVRSFSSSDYSATATRDSSESDGVEITKYKHKQPFVTTEIEPQEWDHAKTDPLHRPKYRSRARILSKHDYARQPSVTFEDQYDNFADAMITLSWMDRETQSHIYKNYLGWMLKAHETYGRTSHEYVCRLIAQKFRITPQRAAAIIQLQHNEQQLKMQNEQLFEDDADLMDAYMKNTIEQAYRSTGEIPPERFIEMPDTEGGMESPKTMIVEDVMDMDRLVREANVREQERAKVMINEHIYKEDVDDETIGININEATKQCITQKENLKAQVVPDPLPSPTALAAEQQKEKRPRWKFAAQIVDTRELHPRSKYSKYKKLGKKVPSYFGKKHRMGFLNNFIDNVVIEHDGELRAANLAEVKKMPWKPIRVNLEHTYAGVQKAWLDRTVRGDLNAWGLAPVPEEATNGAITDDTNYDINGEDIASSSDSELSSSDSDDSPSDSDVEAGSLNAASEEPSDGDDAEKSATEMTPDTSSTEKATDKLETKDSDIKDDK